MCKVLACSICRCLIRGFDSCLLAKGVAAYSSWIKMLRLHQQDSHATNTNM